MARAFYNSLTKADQAISAGTHASIYPEKTLGDFNEETRTMKVMREIGLDLADASRQEITPELAQKVDQIVSFLPLDELPEWLRDDPKIQVWQIKNYPAPDLETARHQRDEIAARVRKMVQ